MLWELVHSGGVLGMMNVGSRFLGGAASDFAGGLRGMRGRLWVLQVLLAFEGVFCLLVGISHESLPATVGGWCGRWPVSVARGGCRL